VYLKQAGRKVVVQSNEAQDRHGLRALLNAVMNLGFVKKDVSY
jgi:hypothetical protein